ncbi:MAG: hypothetical protein HYV75_01160 [Opitutae bacterium]|nr:hypothetical protein [Opitutae bacterium]
MIPRTKNFLAVGLAATLAVNLPAAPAVDKDPAAKPAKAELPQLQLTVDVPPHWRPFLADDLADVFASRVADVFRRQGYTGQVNFLALDDPKPDQPVLAIRLIHWRLGRTDNAECTFTASVKAGGREQSLGVFENTTLVWISGLRRWGLADALGDAPDAALRDLAGKLAGSATVPGFPAAKK